MRHGWDFIMKSSLTFNNSTVALKAQRQLKQSGINSSLVKLTSDSSGCTYALEIDRADMYSAVYIMRNLGMDFAIRD